MMRMQLVRNVLVLSFVLAIVLAQSAAAQEKLPWKPLHEKVYFPAVIDSGKSVAFFKLEYDDKTAYSRLCVADAKTREEKILFPDIDFNRDKLQAYSFMPDGDHVALVDKNLTLCDIWLHDCNDQYASPIRLTELEQFDPGIPIDQLYALGMNRKGVLEVKQLDISPDGKKIIMTFGILGKTAIWMYEIDRNHYRQMTPDRVGFLPKWMPDNEHFVYAMIDSVSGNVGEDIWIMSAKTNEKTPLVQSGLSDGWPSPSADGKYVSYLEYNGKVWNVCVVRVSDRKTVRLTDFEAPTSCGYVIFNADGTGLLATITTGPVEPMNLYEIPFDPEMFD